MGSKPKFTEKKYSVILVFVTSLFLLWGIAIDALSIYLLKR